MKLSLPKFWNNKKTRYILLTTVVIVVIGGAVGVNFGLSRQYSQSLSTWQGNLNSFLAEQGKKIKDTDDALKIKEALQAAQQRTQQSPPAAPQFLGITLASGSTSHTAVRLTGQAHELSARLGESVELITYQNEVLKPVAALSGKSAKNLDELKSLDALWREQTAITGKITPPEKYKEPHRALLAGLEAVSTGLAALIPLFEKKEADAFIAKRNELNEKITALQQLGHQFAEIAKQQDAQLSQQIQQLQQ